MRTDSAGYVEGIDYTHGYYRELSPAHLAFVALNRRRRIETRQPLRYLELGCGHGESLAIHAAACPGEYWGTDLNPVHAANARELAEASGSGARIFELPFADFAALPELPQFDVIALHGVWSWVSAANRAVIVDLFKRHLAPGGLVYLSYNTTPGWSASVPLRQLMALHAELAGAGTADLGTRIDGALQFAERMREAGAFYFQANPDAAARLQGLLAKDRHYLAHEYFNRDWQPMTFAEVAALLAEAGLDFAGSANLLDHADDALLSPQGLAVLAEAGHPLLRETARDMLINQAFRKDAFVRGINVLLPQEQQQRYLEQRFILPMPVENVPQQVHGPMGELTLQPAAFLPLLDMLAEHGHAPKSVAELLQHPAWGGKPLAQLKLALTVLAGAGFIAPVQEAAVIARATPYCAALNGHLFERAARGRPFGFLASPVTGGGISVGTKQQLFLAARRQGLAEPEQWASHAWPLLAAQGQRLCKDGEELESEEDNMAELVRIAELFAARALPILVALGIA